MAQQVPPPLNKSVEVLLRPVLSSCGYNVYTCPYHGCEYSNPVTNFQTAIFARHLVQHHAQFFVLPIEARHYGSLNSFEEHIKHPELVGTDVTDRVLDLAKAYIRERGGSSGVSTGAGLRRGEKFNYVHIFYADRRRTPHFCCAHCEFAGPSLITFKEHVGEKHVAVRALLVPGEDGGQETTTWEVYGAPL
jgi:hypothetical protein